MLESLGEPGWMGAGGCDQRVLRRAGRRPDAHPAIDTGLQTSKRLFPDQLEQEQSLSSCPNFHTVLAARLKCLNFTYSLSSFFPLFDTESQGHHQPQNQSPLTFSADTALTGCLLHCSLASLFRGTVLQKLKPGGCGGVCSTVLLFSKYSLPHLHEE